MYHQRKWCEQHTANEAFQHFAAEVGGRWKGERLTTTKLIFVEME